MREAVIRRLRQYEALEARWVENNLEWGFYVELERPEGGLGEMSRLDSPSQSVWCPLVSFYQTKESTGCVFHYPGV